MLLKRSLEIIIGFLSICLGLTALIIPVLPTSPFLFFGILLISPHHGKKLVEYLKKLIKKITKKAP